MYFKAATACNKAGQAVHRAGEWRSVFFSYNGLDMLLFERVLRHYRPGSYALPLVACHEALGAVIGFREQEGIHAVREALGVGNVF